MAFLSQMKPKMNKDAAYKSWLNEFTQKSHLSLPEYQTRIEGLNHAPMFRSCVLINGKSYESQEAFPNRKAAEQDAAKLALEQLTGVRRDQSYSVPQDPADCKSILNEYAAKLQLKRPEYATIPRGDMDKGFISSLVFEGKIYQGEAGLSKKRAEQLAAHAAIRSLLDSQSEVLCQIINSKAKIYDAACQFKASASEPSNLPVGASPDASVEPSTKDIDIPNVDTVVNSSGGNKRKRSLELLKLPQKAKKCKVISSSLRLI